ncbi:hypothetical protein M2103_001426 [Ereboglobus sp. PH5-5]|uniref:sialidase family protein n=1 Tax=Ereboglobus sp. PH5-5 TaxID=2940529 RepID=UPI002406C67A|nr:sialidase family protein [Ereboglobus sp. PH5-5]MDF9833204.1 hypothetical protein [Ereboglobus sp. PH5-5]
MVSARASQRLIKTFSLCLVCALCLAAPLIPAASITLEWNTGANEFVTRGGYARMKKLSTGEIALVFSSGDSVCIKKKSARAGAWGPAVRVASPAKESGYRYTNAEMCELADGRLCYTWNARPVRKDGHLPYKIMAAFSSDGGRTWGGARDLHVAGNTRRTGCWEPCPIQLPSGELQVWYADESITPAGDQTIAVLRSRDNGATWLKPVTASYRKGKRDGMPVPVLLKNNKGLVVAIEDNGIDGAFKPAIISLTPEGNVDGVVGGQSPRRWHALRRDCRLPAATYAGAPYLIQLSTGETVLSVQSTENRRNEAHKFANLHVYVGDDSAKNFANKSTPFPDLPENAAALWNSLCQVDDDALVAVATINGLPRDNGIWIATARITRSRK